MILPAQALARGAAFGRLGPCRIVEPFLERGVCNGKSYGLSSAGYDIRIAQTVWVWPLFGRLGSSVEEFAMPDDVAGFVCDKSSWARRFVSVQNTFIEPGWRGYLTLEITRHRPWPVRIRKGTPIAQVVFVRLEEPTDRPYAGKYQNQPAGPQPVKYEVITRVEGERTIRTKQGDMS